MCIEAEIIERYRQNKSFFLNSIDITQSIKAQIRSKDISKNIPEMYGILLFIRIYEFAETVRKLLPEDINKINSYSDYSAIISLARCIMDCSLTLFYLCFESDDKKVKLARYEYIILLESKLDIKAFDYEENIKTKYKDDLSDAQELLYKDQVFNKLPQSDSFKGSLKNETNIKQSFGISNKELIRRMNYVTPDDYNLANSLFSYFVHTSPGSIYLRQYKGNDPRLLGEWILKRISFALNITSWMILHASINLIDKILNKTTFIREQFSEQEAAELKEIRIKLEKLMEP